MKPPKPETKVAGLVNCALSHPTVTVHRYLDTRRCVIPGPNGGDAWEFIFQCTVTGFERRWGYELITDLEEVGN